MMSSTIGSSSKRGRGERDANKGITVSSDGQDGNDKVIESHEVDEGSSEEANDGLVVRQSNRAKSESTAPNTSESITPVSSSSFSSSSSSGALSEGGTVTMTNISNLS